MIMTPSLSLLSAGLLVFLSSCGKDAAEVVAEAVTVKASCNFSSLGYCTEYLVDNYTGSDQTTCTNTNGSYAASGCPDGGKVKGCELKTNGLKVTRSWAYNDVGLASVEATCNAVINQNNSGLSAEFIDP